MKNGIMLFGIVAGSVFALTIVGGTVAAWGAQPSSSGTPTADVQREATLQARDQEARDLIALANERILAASDTPLPTPEPSATALPSPTPWPISPAAAEAIVHIAAYWAVITVPPALVDFQGVTAYEVQTNFGPVYVDATNGQVLFNGALRISNDAASSSSSSGGASGGGHSENRGSEHDD
jgi:hypothetical protein